METTRLSLAIYLSHRIRPLQIQVLSATYRSIASASFSPRLSIFFSLPFFDHHILTAYSFVVFIRIYPRSSFLFLHQHRQSYNHHAHTISTISTYSHISSSSARYMPPAFTVLALKFPLINTCVISYGL
jgi:hypothetical protein